MMSTYIDVLFHVLTPYVCAFIKQKNHAHKHILNYFKSDRNFLEKTINMLMFFIWYYAQYYCNL